MRLDRLLEHVETVAVKGDPASIEIDLITHDSSQVAPGTLFCCVRGGRVDGHDFVADAVARGAVAVVVDHPVGVTVAQVVVGDVRASMAALAAALHGSPATRMHMLGVTGTNGKTTTVHLLAAILGHAGRRVAQIGTLHPAAVAGGPPNTPDAPVLQAVLAELVTHGTDTVAMEVSSHALAQRRVDSIVYRVAGFTNLTQDHLDFHHSMSEYFEAKAQLFTPEHAALGVVNRDDPWGRTILERGGIPMVAYSLDEAEDLEVGLSRSSFSWRGERIVLPLGGAFNVSNALCAALMAEAEGVATSVIAEGLTQATPIAGRFEVVDGGQEFTVVIDYAHTPDGLRHVLDAARASIGGHRVIVVFGCGGDKDRGKRPQMGAIAEQLADVVVVTSDNPRSEDPRAIIAEILAGIDHPGAVHVDPDRRAAIAVALDLASPGDVVVIAGKGHETGQETGGVVLPFDDREVARSLLVSKTGTAS